MLKSKLTTENIREPLDEFKFCLPSAASTRVRQDASQYEFEWSLIEWSRGSLGDNREYCRGRIFESMSTSWELSSEELKSLGMGLARALDEDAAMRNNPRT